MKTIATALTLGALLHSADLSADSCDPVLDFEHRRLAGDKAGQCDCVTRIGGRCPWW